MSLPGGVVECMLRVLNGLPEPNLVVTRREAMAVVREQEALGGCLGPLCRGLAESLALEPFEAVYAITVTGLVPVGVGGLEVDGGVVAGASAVPGFLGLFHTHPAGIVVPTPYDLAGAKLRGSRVECTGARAWGGARILCLEARDPGDWEELAVAYTELGDIVLSSDYYTPYRWGESIVFVPHPSPRLALEIEHEALAIAYSLGFNAYIIDDGGIHA